jgi:cardiolipin synthase A/B
MRDDSPALPSIRTAQHTLTLLASVESLLELYLRDLETAKTRVYMEIYIFGDDDFGQLIGKALVAAAKRGVPVYVLYDRLGSQEADPAFFQNLRDEGVFVRAYRPIEAVAKSIAPFPRDHSRNFVVDDHAYTGGVAWAHPWLPKSRGGDEWHDVGVRVEGPVVEDFVKLFQQRWTEADGAIEKPCDFCTLEQYPDLELVSDTPSHDSKVFNRHVEAIEKARSRIHITNSYFYPSKIFMGALYDAAKRGVDVKIVMCGESDLPIVSKAAHGADTAWLEHGIQLFEFQPTTLHAKYAVIDDDWCTVGTFNANPTSVAMANELNLFVKDKSFVAAVEAQFEKDLAQSKPVTKEELAKRPASEKVTDFAALQALRTIDFIAGPRPQRDSADKCD